MANKKIYELEYQVNASPKLLYNYLSTISGLSEWFADDINSRGDEMEFIWDDDTRATAHIIAKKQGAFIRFKWEGDIDSDAFFEMKIQIDELTKDVSLIITDFAEENEMEDAVQLWNAQISKLLQVLGS
ncbi:MAG: SRPBCC domain-containing protein [Flavobacteriales bacterium]|nr:SRPBCC domain-containing protein [Flavobacteriales bacterium]